MRKPRISSKGVVRTSYGVLYKGSVNKDEYVRAEMYGSSRYIHVILGIASGFVPKNRQDYTINHKDGVRGNNTKENLELMTPSEQEKHKFKMRKEKGIVLENRGRKQVEQKNLEGEVWKEVVIENTIKTGCFVSNLSRFKNALGISYTIKEHYGEVKIPLNGGQKSFTFSRLVWYSFNNYFISSDEKDGFEVDHINEDTRDHRLENLQRLTKKEHDEKTLASESRKSNGPALSKPIQGKKKGSNDEWVNYKSSYDAATKIQEKYKVKLHQANISAVCNCKRTQTGGFEFRYLPEDPALLEGEWFDVEKEWTMPKYFEKLAAELYPYKDNPGKMEKDNLKLHQISKKYNNKGVMKLYLDKSLKKKRLCVLSAVKN